jgi:hypothetical protein
MSEVVVVDARVAIKWVVAEEFSKHATALLTSSGPWPPSRAVAGRAGPPSRPPESLAPPASGATPARRPRAAGWTAGRRLV